MPNNFYSLGLIILLLIVAIITYKRKNRLMQEISRKLIESEKRLQHFIKSSPSNIWHSHIEENRHYLRAVLDNFPFLVWLKDPEGRFLIVNKPFAQACGLTSPEALIGKTDLDIWPQDLAELYRNDDRQVLNSGNSKNVEELLQNKEQRIWIETYKSPVIIDNEILGTVGFARNITNRKQAEAALSQQRSFLKTLIQTIPDLIWLKDPKGVYLACNPRFEQFFGANETDIVGKTDYDFLEPQLAQFFINKDKLAIENGISTVNEEWITFANDGHRELLETTKTPMFDEHGNLIGVLGIGHDVTERKRIEERLRQAASVFEHARESIMITGPDNIILDVNTAFTRFTGYNHDEVVGQNPRFLKSDCHDKAFYINMWQSLNQNGYWHGEIWNRHKCGTIFAGMQTISAVHDENGNVLRYVSLFTDITALKEYQKQLEYIAHYDALTELPNRVLLADRLHQAMELIQQHNSLLAVAYLDLDGFKIINDIYGHEVGDNLLSLLAKRMKQTLRDSDTLARLGGDEFIAVLFDLPTQDASIPILQRLLIAAAEPILINNVNLTVSASIGVTFFPQLEIVDADQLLRQADQAMYQAKQSGKNRYYLFDIEDDRNIRNHHEGLTCIREALINNEFVLYYQPKVNMRTGQIIGVEALIRWQHPTRGLLAPSAFLPVIENHPLGLEVGKWVLETAMTQIESWRQMQLFLPISINMDAQQLQQPGFITMLQEQLACHPGIQPGDLEFEVLETNALKDIAQVSETILACQKLGISCALDDFGTGYSSLTYLKRLPTNLLKIDQSFVHDMLNNPEDLAILEGVLGLASSFCRQTIAEGVETLAQGKLLLQMGCELGQGFAISRPMPAEQLNTWVENWHPDAIWLNRTPLGRDDLSILFAAIWHQAFVNNLERYLCEEQPMPLIMSGDKCHFGKWLVEIGSIRYVGNQSLERIIKLHDAVHNKVEQLLALKHQGHNELACSKIFEIKALRDELLKLLQELIG